jgi:hypothetical protein
VGRHACDHNPVSAPQGGVTSAAGHSLVLEVAVQHTYCCDVAGQLLPRIDGKVIVLQGSTGYRAVGSSRYCQQALPIFLELVLRCLQSWIGPHAMHYCEQYITGVLRRRIFR